MLRAALILACMTVFAAACGGDSDKPQPTAQTTSAASTRDATPAHTATASAGNNVDLSEHEDELREAAVESVKEIFAGTAFDAYQYASSAFKEKCPFGDFAGLIAFFHAFVGDFEKDQITMTVTGVRFEDDRAFVDATLLIQNEDVGTEETDDFNDFWVYEDGAWKWSTDEEEPCDIGLNSDSGDGDKTPASGPGASRAEPVALGSTIRTADLEFTVLDVNFDATSIIAAQSDFPETPVAGNRLVLIRVRVANVGSGEATADVSTTNFSITGSGNILYDAFDNETSCGFDVPDEIDATLFSGGTADGNVCFQVPAGESGLLLVVEPAFSFDDGDRRFMALE